MIGADFANTASHGAVLAQRLVQTVSGHGEMRRFGRGIHVGEEVAEVTERFRAVKVVGIDRGKRRIDGLARAPDRVGRAPWLGASGRRREAGRKIVELLESVADGDLSFVARADLRAKVFLDIAADEENHAVKSGPHGVMHRIIEEGFSAGPDGIQLLESAVAAAHAGGEDKESGCRHGELLYQQL